MSAKRRRLMPARRQAEQELFDESPWCARCGSTNVALSGHERTGRGVGGDPSKPDVLLCNSCNTWAEDNPDEARRMGWKLPRSALRHAFAPDGIGFYCERCSLPLANWRHREGVSEQ